MKFQVFVFLGVRAFTLLPIIGVALVLRAVFGFPVIAFPLQGFVGLVLILATKILDFESLRAFSAAGGTFFYADPPKRVVATGPYGYVRNPLYLTLFTDTVGLFLIYGWTTFIVILILLVTGINYLVVRWEEPGLEKRFGAAYLDYRKNVPRWIPRIPRFSEVSPRGKKGLHLAFAPTPEALNKWCNACQ